MATRNTIEIERPQMTRDNFEVWASEVWAALTTEGSRRRWNATANLYREDLGLPTKTLSEEA